MMGFVQRYSLLIILFVAVVMTGGTLMVVSQRVYEKQASINQKNQELVAEEWELRTLKAEWAYLSRPDRIEELATAMGTGALPAAIVSMNDAPSVVNDVQPVSMVVPTPINKPFYMIRPASVSASETVQHRAPEHKTPKPQASGDFSALLKTIGGDE